MLHRNDVATPIGGVTNWIPLVNTMNNAMPYTFLTEDQIEELNANLIQRESLAESLAHSALDSINSALEPIISEKVNYRPAM